MGALLLTRMNPLDVKIWIEGCCALHTNTPGELMTIVPSPVFPEPVNCRSTRPPTGGRAALVDVGAEAPAAFLALGACGVELASDFVELLAAALVEVALDPPL